MNIKTERVGGKFSPGLPVPDKKTDDHQNKEKKKKGNHHIDEKSDGPAFKGSELFALEPFESLTIIKRKRFSFCHLFSEYQIIQITVLQLFIRQRNFSGINPRTQGGIPVARIVTMQIGLFRPHDKKCFGVESGKRLILLHRRQP